MDKQLGNILNELIADFLLSGCQISDSRISFILISKYLLKAI